MSQGSLPIVAGTLQTDPRSGGLKRNSGVNVLPVVAEGESSVVTYRYSSFFCAIASSDLSCLSIAVLYSMGSSA